ncbi:hypothetical protein [Cellvibrio polysaccharolyticus]|uniref:Polysaccharide deacetylase n=1 Tax=Cellvibrio polysaccharolyticus TaxID=2082724 RepID=A0A928V3F4_9GAMM|nr:hypothetical protein [Cellvibrio polysaccharolyticus]MBE8716495.1 hypothetical protein [Cellvibrio polysaccharolyticus]
MTLTHKKSILLYGRPARFIPHLKQLVAMLVLCMLSVAVPAADVMFAFSDAHSRSTSLDANARIQLITGQLKRMDIPPGIVLVKTGDIQRRNQQAFGNWLKAGYLPVNYGHRYHLLARPDDAYPERDFLRAHRHLRNFSEYRHHIYFPAADAETPWVQARGWTPVAIALRLETGLLDFHYQQNSTRHRQLNMQLLQDEVAAAVLKQARSQMLVQQGIAPAAPLVIELSADDITAYVLPAIVDALVDGGFRFVAPDTSFLPPYARAGTGNLADSSRYVATLLQLPVKQPGYPGLVNTASLMSDPARFGFNTR